jgi:hypothetical protein
VDAGPGDDAAAVRWLALDRDVVTRGTDGSGRFGRGAVRQQAVAERHRHGDPG